MESTVGSPGRGEDAPKPLGSSLALSWRGRVRNRRPHTNLPNALGHLFICGAREKTQSLQSEKPGAEPCSDTSLSKTQLSHLQKETKSSYFVELL